jgi:hypothetical protein
MIDVLKSQSINFFSGFKKKTAIHEIIGCAAIGLYYNVRFRKEISEYAGVERE